MAMTLRLPAGLEADLRAESRRTGRPQAVLVKEALERLLASDGADNHIMRLPGTPYRPVPPELQLAASPKSGEILDRLREDRLG